MSPNSPEMEFMRLTAELAPFLRSYWRWLARAEDILVEIYQTAYAVAAWEEYEGNGLPLGLRDILLEEANSLTAYDHLDLMLTEQFAVEDSLYWAQQEGDPTVILLIELYQGATNRAAQALVLICARLNEVGLLDLFCMWSEPSQRGED